MNWFRFFAGTPRRFLVSVVVLLVVAAYISPEWVEMAAERVTTALTPLFPMILWLVIIGIGFRIMLSPLFSRRGRRD